MARTDLFLFESAFARDTYTAMIGRPPGLVRVVCNGVSEAEFEPITLAPDTTDIVYVGEFRRIKGADILIDAVERLNTSGRDVRLTLAGDGEESEALKAQVAGLSHRDKIRFVGFVPARRGFSLGRLLVVPSRGDSLPYVVLEAAAAGVPMIASRVGGIPEIFGPEATRLVPPEDSRALADAIATTLDDPAGLQASTKVIQDRVRQYFSQDVMVDGVLQAYADTFAAKAAAGCPPGPR
jgi:glycosyltransferase involved in cell wall biosynthesis